MSLIVLLLEGPWPMLSFIVSGFLVLLIPSLLAYALGPKDKGGAPDPITRGCALGCAVFLFVPVIVLLIVLAQIWV